MEKTIKVLQVLSADKKVVSIDGKGPEIHSLKTLNRLKIQFGYKEVK